MVYGLPARDEVDWDVKLNASVDAVKTTADSALANAATAQSGADASAKKASNLSDLASAPTARTNLGLGDSATKNTGTAAGTVAAGDDSRITGAAQKASNLADLANAATARTNLGLGNVDNTSDANKPVSTATQTALNGKVAVASNSRHPLTGWYHTSGFGAVGDWNGTTGTDNLTAFNAAVTQLTADGGKGVIYIDKPGKYRLSDGWMITGDDVAVYCHPNAEVLTTTATSTLGATVTFMGGGIQTPSNAVDTPQATRAEWIGGRISSSGSGTSDNALGFVRYKNAHAAGVRLDADRKALTAQYNVDNIVFERFVVERAGLSAVTIETSCNDATVTDFDIISATSNGVHILSVDASTRRNARIRVRNGLIRSVGGWGVLAGATDVLDIKAVTVSAATGGKYDYTDCTFVTTDQPMSTGGTAKASGFGWENGESTTLTLQNSWVAQGGTYATPAAVRNPSGLVLLTGNIKSGTATAGTILCNLPVGYRPRAFLSFVADSIDSTGAIVAARVSVATNGNVVLEKGGNNFALSLCQVMFFASL